MRVQAGPPPEELAAEYFPPSARAPEAGGDAPSTIPFTSQLLRKQADLYSERNAVYKDNFRMVGRVMKALFPDGPPRLETEADFNRWHLFELAIVKLTRYCVVFNEGGHPDSIDDMIVYLAMVAALDQENGHRG